MQERLQKEINQIWGNWEITKFIGEGSFGRVYQIEKEEFDYTYKAALKTIKIPKSQDEIATILNEFGDEKSVTEYYREIVGDIVKEIVLMSKLKGITNIVSYEDHAVIPNEDKIGWDIYIRMELLIPLFEYTKEHQLSVRDVIQLGIDMCKAIEVCQKYNIIHRDIKPENIFVSEMGDYKLGDFGISRQLEKTALEFSQKGTYSYMAPEVYKGKNYNSNVDIYSLGIVLYRFLNNNRLPFLPAYPQKISYNDRNKALIMRTSGEKLPKPCNADGRLAEIVLKACAYDPKDRYESAVDMRKALESVLYEKSMADMVYPNEDILSQEMINEKASTDEEKKRIIQEVEMKEEALKEDETVCLFENINDNVETEEDKTSVLLSENEDDNDFKEEILHKTDIENIEEEENFENNGEETIISDEGSKKDSPKLIFEVIKEKKKIITGIVAVLILGIGILAYQMLTRITVPDVTNITIKEAEKRTKNNLKIVKVSLIYSDKIKKGNIISQKVKVGTKLKKGKELPVVVSKGVQIIVPNILTMNKNEAQKALNSYKLQMSVQEEYSSKIKRDYIISQSIEAGQKVDEGTVIKVVVSKGIEQVKVPKVTGKSKKTAIKQIKTAGLRYTIILDYSRSIKEGKIISQSIKSGKYVDKGKKVRLVVSLGKRPVVTTESAPSTNRRSTGSGGNNGYERKTTAAKSSTKSQKSSESDDDDVITVN